MTARLSLVSLGLAMLAAIVVVVNQQVAWALEEAEASERPCDVYCTQEYDPVCASNGQTFANECLLKQATCQGKSISLVSRGECQSSATITKRSAPEDSCESICTQDFTPVCGSDGVTYSNTCYLSIATCNDDKVEQAHEGACE